VIATSRVLTDPPLDTPPDEARSSLRRELLKPEYNEQNLVQRVLDWTERQVNRGLDAASDAPPLSTLAAMVILVGLVLLIGWLVSQARRTASSAETDRAVLTDEAVTADELRHRADSALAAGRHEERLPDTPGATAHEVALALGAEHAHLSERIEEGGRLFDAVLYGDRPATAAQAAAVVSLDDELLVRR
jgi:hypothetical protein